MLTDSQMQDKGYALNDDEVGDLLLTIKGADQITEAYSTAWFRVMLQEVNKVPFANQDDGLEALEQADKRLYPLVKAKVLDGVTDPIERNRKTAFHRVAKHLVKKAIIMACTGEKPWDRPEFVTKNDIVKAWNKRVKVFVDPVDKLIRDFDALRKKAHQIEVQGISTNRFFDHIRTYL